MGVKTDISAMQARVKATQRAVAVAGRSAVVAAGDALVDAIERIAPYDTNRYIRGWQLAIQAAGSGVEGAKTRQVKALKESRFMAQNFDRLDRQVKRLEKARSGLVNRLQKWFYGTGRPLGKWGRRAEAKVAQLDKLIVRAKVQRRLIDDDEGTALVIGRALGRSWKSLRLEDVKRRCRAQLVFIRNNALYRMALSPDGEMYVGDGYGNARVHRFSAEGELLQSWGEPGTGPGQFNLVHSVWVHTDGRVFICDRENDRVQIFGPTGELLVEIAQVLAEVPNRLTLEGHTDAQPFSAGERGYSNWELSSDRANASRRELLAGGLPDNRIVSVVVGSVAGAAGAAWEHAAPSSVTAPSATPSTEPEPPRMATPPTTTAARTRGPRICQITVSTAGARPDGSPVSLPSSERSRSGRRSMGESAGVAPPMTM